MKKGSMENNLSRVRPDWDRDFVAAQESAQENGTNVYSEMEDLGYTRDEILEEEGDPYSENPELLAYLNATDTSPSNEEWGLDEDGVRDDD